MCLRMILCGCVYVCVCVKVGRLVSGASGRAPTSDSYVAIVSGQKRGRMSNLGVPRRFCSVQAISLIHLHRMPGRGLRERHPRDHCRVVQSPGEAFPLQAAPLRAGVRLTDVKLMFQGWALEKCRAWAQDECLACLEPLEKGSFLCYSFRRRAPGEGV